MMVMMMMMMMMMMIRESAIRNKVLSFTCFSKFFTPFMGSAFYFLSLFSSLYFPPPPPPSPLLFFFSFSFFFLFSFLLGEHDAVRPRGKRVHGVPVGLGAESAANASVLVHGGRRHSGHQPGHGGGSCRAGRRFSGGSRVGRRLAGYRQAQLFVASVERRQGLGRQAGRGADQQEQPQLLAHKRIIASFQRRKKERKKERKKANGGGGGGGGK